MTRGEIVAVNPLHFLGVGSASCRVAVRTTPIVDDDVVILRATDGVQANPIEPLDDRPDGDIETGLLAHLARERCLERLAHFDGATRQAPLPFQRFVGALYEQHAVAIDDDRADRDDWAGGIVSAVIVHPIAFVRTRSPEPRDDQSFIPITFTTTRFFRCPSNSA